ncbi:MAG: hypothetical protein FD180_4918 [Planctomycetota bacterium]|nr:MAG: hypothetical protein FD180_4918 [Planctomycetota bacterium]
MKRVTAVAVLLLLLLLPLAWWKMPGGPVKTPPSSLGALPRREAPPTPGTGPSGEGSGNAGKSEQGPGESSPDPRFAVSGRLLRFDGTPEPYSAICLSHSLSDTHYAVTDAHGAFRLESERPGKCHITTEDSSFPRVVTTIEIPADRDLDGVEIRLPRTWDVTVHLVDRRGAAVDGRVGASVGDHDYFASTDELGVATLRLGDGAEATFFGSCKDRPLLPPRDVVAPRGQAFVTLVADDAGVASGHVRWPGGEPMLGVDIFVRVNSSKVSSATTGDDGEFEILVPLEAVVSLEFDSERIPAPGEDERHVEGKLEGVRAGDTGLEFRTAWVPMDRALTVRIFGPDGPMASALVMVGWDLQFELASGLTDATGEWSSDKLPRGTVFVSVAAPDVAEDFWVPEPVLVSAESASVSFTLRRGREVAGELRTTDGIKLYVAHLEFFRGGERVATWECGDPDVFSVLIPAEGSGPLEIRATGFGGQKSYSGRASEVDPGARPIVDLAPSGNAPAPPWRRRSR